MPGSLPLRRRRTFVAFIAAVAALLLTLPLVPGASAEAPPAATALAAARAAVDHFDARQGAVAPSRAAESAVAALEARAEWNRYGTPASLINHDGVLAKGLSRDPVTAARSFISSQKALFRLSDEGVRNLELVNDSKLTGSKGHVVLFRQRFGSLPAAQDGMVSVAVKKGKIFYVSSSLVGDGNEPAEAKLSPTAAWQKAAGSVGRAASAQATLGEVREEDGWTVFSVPGLNQLQRSRLVALPTPNDGVKSAYETIVYDSTPGGESAHTVFVDAVSGEVLLRVNRLDHLNANAALAPTAGEFEGSYTPQDCGPTHPIDVDDDTQSIYVFATAVNPANDIEVHILRNGVVVGGPGDTGTSPEFSVYNGVASDPAGTQYAAQVCPFSAASQVAPPYTYAGSYVTTNVAADSLPFPPRWKYFLANPELNGSDTDTRKVGCFTRADAKYLANPPALPAGCDREEGNIAARLPWDVDPTTGAPTFTTRGNAAQSMEAWESPFVPPAGDNYSPPATDRKYNFPWIDQWRDSTNPADPGTGCSPTVFGTPGFEDPRSGRNDIDASITNLFVQHNRMHDWSYFLGFTENNWNMQVSNFGNDATGTVPGNGDKDPEIGGAQAGAVDGGFPSFRGRDNANQITLNDGVPGITNMYLWQPLPATFYAPCVDGDFDMSVIGHEYTHAISNRMVGGPDAGLTSSLDGQARAMGESYSDLTAVEYLNEYKYVPTNGENPFSVGAYVTGNKQLGIRNYGMNNSPLNFSNVQGYDGSGVNSPHDDGEIWSAVNFQIRQAMIARYNGAFPASNAKLQKRCADGVLPANKCPGNRRWMQIVFDAYLMMPPQVTMLGARNAYLAADQMRFGGANQGLLWKEFALRGFGVNAKTTDTNDPQPTPNFESKTATNEATITFKPVTFGGDPIPNARIYVGRYEGRVTPIADTNPGTQLGATARFLPGTYQFVVAAPGYGLSHHIRTFDAGITKTKVFGVGKNWASIHNGATVVPTATDGANFDALLDDTEATNWNSKAGKGGPPTVEGRQFTVDLGGGAHPVDTVRVSALLRSGSECNEVVEECDPQDLSQNRFSALRQFAIEICTANANRANSTCSDRSTVTAAGVGWNRVFTSQANAFPGGRPRPLSPNLTLRYYDIPGAPSATHVRMVVLNNQCTGNSAYHGDQDADPLVGSDCRTNNSVLFPFDPDPSELILAPQDTTVRAAELEVFSSGGEGSGGSGTPQDPFVAFAKTGPAVANQGEKITYTLDYANLGPAASEGVKITDKLPKGVKFVSATGPDSYNSSTRTVTWKIGTVPLLAKGSVTLTVRVGSGVATGSVITNTATFTGAETTATPAVWATLIL